MNRKHVAAALLVAMIWGVNFVVIRIALDSFPPLLLAALRFVVAALPVLFLRRPPVRLGMMIAVGSTLFVGQFAFLFTGMAHGMPPGLASVTLQIQAFFTIAIAAAVLGELPRPRQIAGSAVALAGLGVIAWSAGGRDVSALGFGFSIAAALSWAAGNVLLRRAGKVDMLAMISWLSLVPIAPLLALSLVFEGPGAITASLSAPGWSGVAALLYISVLTTTFGFAVWGQLLKLYPAATVAPFSLLVPIFGILAAVVFLGEAFGPPRIAGAALILAGLVLVVMPAGSRRAA